MTYRERRERRAERLRDWGEKREARGTAELDQAHEQLSAIPFGQPILVGHHSERTDRRYRARAHAAMDRGVENLRTAESMSTRADEIERQAERSIYRDDPDAIDRLREKLRGLEAQREAMKARNATYRAEHKAELKAMSAYQRAQAVPHPPYALQNLGGVISSTRKRIELVPVQQANAARDRIITARFGSSCADCGAPLERGGQIRYSKAAGARCVECAA